MKQSVFDIEIEDRPRLIQGRRFGIIGGYLFLAGGVGMIATSQQTEWDVARSFYIALMALGFISVVYGQKTLRPLVKKYLRPFPFIS
mgnify:FL=1